MKKTLSIALVAAMTLSAVGMTAFAGVKYNGNGTPDSIDNLVAEIKIADEKEFKKMDLNGNGEVTYGEALDYNYSDLNTPTKTFKTWASEGSATAAKGITPGQTVPDKQEKDVVIATSGNKTWPVEKKVYAIYTITTDDDAIKENMKNLGNKDTSLEDKLAELDKQYNADGKNAYDADKADVEGRVTVKRYKENDTIIAIDLKNEPHGKANEEKAIWNNSDLDNNWKHVAEVAGNLVLDQNPNLLIIIEGIEIYPKDISANGDFSSTNMDDYLTTWWGANLRGVKDYPIDFGNEARNRQIVYSPHDYGPTVYQQPWFSGDYNYETLKTDCWNDNWLYIHNDRIAPILIGEWGGFMEEPNLTWMTYIRQLIGENNLNFTFWCFNSNSGDTGGLVLDDFKTWDNTKYGFVKEVLWQQDGKFVGLDHAVPLGNRGIPLSEYNGVIDPDNVPAETTAPSATTLPDGTEETSAPGETTKAAAAATAVAAKKGGFPVGKIVLYGFLFLLLILVAVLVYMFFKNPKAWNNLVDRLHLPEKLKRDIPWEIAPQTQTAESAPVSRNNEFAGRYRPVARTSPSNADTPAKAPASEAKSSEIFKGAATASAAGAAAKNTDRPAAPKPAVSRPDTAKPASASSAKGAPVRRPNMRPSSRSQIRTAEEVEAEVHRLAEQMKAEQASLAAATVDETAKNVASETVSETAKSAPAAAPVRKSIAKKNDEDVPAIVRSLREQEAKQAQEQSSAPAEEIIPTWASSAPTLDHPIWAKPSNPSESDFADAYKPEKKASPSPERKGPIKRPNMRINIHRFSCSAQIQGGANKQLAAFPNCWCIGSIRHGVAEKDKA